MSNLPDNLDSCEANETSFSLRYHERVVEYLSSQRSSLWQWYSDLKHRQEATENAKLELLKTAHRLDRDTASISYLQCDAITKAMNIDAPVTLYQSQKADSRNIAICQVPDEVHIVLYGPIQDLLSETEMEAVLAHELAHFELWRLQNGDFGLAEEILIAMVNDRSAVPSYQRTFRTWKLYTELHCDVRSAQVTDNFDALIRALVKLETEQTDVDTDAYLQQVDEVLGKDNTGSRGFTHPEMYIRAKALAIWKNGSPEINETVGRWIEGPPAIDELDVLQQAKLRQFTTQFLTAFLTPEWLRTDVLLGYLWRFTDSPISAESVVEPELKSYIDGCSASLKEYFCFLLLDLATCDPDLEEAVLAAAFQVADRFGLTTEFRSLSSSQLKIGKRSLSRVMKEAEQIVSEAETRLVN